MILNFCLLKKDYFYNTIKQFIRFSLVGCVGVSIQYSTFYLLYKVFSVYYLIASALGCIIGAFIVFLLNRRWTFNIKQGKAVRQLALFFILMALSIAINCIAIYFFTDIVHIIPEISQIIAMAITTLFNFTGSKFWVFKQSN